MAFVVVVVVAFLLLLLFFFFLIAQSTYEYRGEKKKKMMMMIMMMIMKHVSVLTNERSLGSCIVIYFGSSRNNFHIVGNCMCSSNTEREIHIKIESSVL